MPVGLLVLNFSVASTSTGLSSREAAAAVSDESASGPSVEAAVGSSSGSAAGAALRVVSDSFESASAAALSVALGDAPPSCARVLESPSAFGSRASDASSDPLVPAATAAPAAAPPVAAATEPSSGLSLGAEALSSVASDGSMVRSARLIAAVGTSA